MRLPCVSVLQLLCVEIHRSARRHRVGDQDIQHAYRQAVTWLELGEDPPRYLVAGPNRAGNLLELVVLVTSETEVVIHAMPMRRSTAQELFGKEDR